MKKIFLFIVLLLSFSGYSQEVDFNDSDFLRFKEDYIKLMTSNDYDNYLKLYKEFRGKLPTDLVGTEEIFAELISEQISKSKFNSVQEALDLQKKNSGH